MNMFKTKKIVIGLVLSASLLAGGSSARTAVAAPLKLAKSAKKTVYVCSMHPEVVSSKPGKCPKCGMKFTKKMVKTIYTCPMHPKVLSLKPGKCPICKMSMKKQ